jgi:quinoprotein dehydrogenase-associated probable ABC transporter substrate-binding protein
MPEANSRPSAAPARRLALPAGAVAVSIVAFGWGTLAPARSDNSDPTAFRVCADPNNLPFSNRDRQGFENKLADLIAAKLGRHVSYVWWAQRRGFVRNTLKAGDCDVVMGVPAHYDLVEATRPYYRSTYVFVSRADRNLDISSLKDPRLRKLSIGVQLIGNDGFNTPPAHALGEEGIVKNVIGFTVYGDYRNANPAARIVDAVAQRKIDIAAAWGPLAGYFARHSAVPLTVTPISDTAAFKPLLFQYDIAIGVRKGDHALKDRINAVLASDHSEVEHLLADYGVPMVNGEVATPR